MPIPAVEWTALLPLYSDHREEVGREGVGIDYALFVLTRYRAELATHERVDGRRAHTGESRFGRRDWPGARAACREARRYRERSQSRANGSHLP